jgi:hypothetical protein
MKRVVRNVRLLLVGVLRLMKRVYSDAGLLLWGVKPGFTSCSFGSCLPVTTIISAELTLGT